MHQNGLRILVRLITWLMNKAQQLSMHMPVRGLEGEGRHEQGASLDTDEHG
jgi:hypothetical protein